MSVQGIYEGMKVTADGGIDASKFQVQSGKGLQRKGDVLGWQKVRVLWPASQWQINDNICFQGYNEEVLFGERDALWYYYILPYKQLLDDVLGIEVAALRHYLQQNKKIIILDTERNFDVDNVRKPLSHGYLLKCYLENNYPLREDIDISDLYK